MTSKRYHSTDEYLQSVARMIRAAGRRVGGEDPEQLALLVQLHQAVTEATEDAIFGQRQAGIQWSSMGDALGVTKQAVIQRWASRIDERSAQLAASAGNPGLPGNGQQVHNPRHLRSVK